MRRRDFLTLASAAAGCARRRDRPLAVLTFDDAVRSHRAFVAPLLQEFGFGATFFVTHRWMADPENFMSWEEIAEIHAMGFEIGNHSWTHADFSSPRNAARLEGELALVENELAKVGVPPPESFAWCGNGFGPEALAKLRALGFRFARRGMQPERPYGEIAVGPAFDPARHDRLLIPTTGDAYPDWSLEHFQALLERAADGVVVLQFHGVPDVAHPWVHTPPENFRGYLEELRAREFEVLALRELATGIGEAAPDDPLTEARYPEPENGELERPVEQQATRADLGRWSAVMARFRYSPEEAAEVAALDADERAGYQEQAARPVAPARERVEVLPYPGGRHPRIGFLEGAVDPLRGTKAGVFLPWNTDEYVVIDLPELITSNLGHLFLAHTHVPTIWNDQNLWLDNVDWRPRVDGGLEFERPLPNGVVFGSKITPRRDDVALELWLRNGLDRPLSELRTQICVMLKGAPEFNEQIAENKLLRPPVAAASSRDKRRWILTAWNRTGRSWGNPRCPCFHADPVFEDCAPGETVRMRGRLWFYEGADVEAEVAAAAQEFRALDESVSG